MNDIKILEVMALYPTYVVRNHKGLYKNPEAMSIYNLRDLLLRNLLIWEQNYLNMNVGHFNKPQNTCIINNMPIKLDDEDIKRFMKKYDLSFDDEDEIWGYKVLNKHTKLGQIEIFDTQPRELQSLKELIESHYNQTHEKTIFTTSRFSKELYPLINKLNPECYEIYVQDFINYYRVEDRKLFFSIFNLYDKHFFSPDRETFSKKTSKFFDNKPPHMLELIDKDFFDKFYSFPSIEYAFRVNDKYIFDTLHKLLISQGYYLYRKAFDSSFLYRIYGKMDSVVIEFSKPDSPKEDEIDLTSFPKEKAYQIFIYLLQKSNFITYDLVCEFIVHEKLIRKIFNVEESFNSFHFISQFVQRLELYFNSSDCIEPGKLYLCYKEISKIKIESLQKQESLTISESHSNQYYIKRIPTGWLIKFGENYEIKIGEIHGIRILAFLIENRDYKHPIESIWEKTGKERSNKVNNPDQENIESAFKKLVKDVKREEKIKYPKEDKNLFSKYLKPDSSKDTYLIKWTIEEGTLMIELGDTKGIIWKVIR